VAIVTEIPGTTRDRIAQAIQIEGVPLNIVDTAGLRETSDQVERMGIARTWAEAAQADVVVHLLDARETDTVAAQAIERELDHRLAEPVPMVRVYNKIDLAGVAARVEQTDSTGTVAERLASGDETNCEESWLERDRAVSSVWLSAKTGAGIDLLRARLLELAGWQASGESTFIARERHLIALRAAQAHVEAAEGHARERARELELFAEELRLAQERLSEITGEFTADDLLGVIFSRFCIGK